MKCPSLEMFSYRLFHQLVGVVLLSLFVVSLALGQDSVSVYATGLVAPMGIEIDSQGRLWVAEAGTGSNDSRISVVTTDGQVHPFLTGLPSEIIEGSAMGAHHLYFDINGDLLIVQGGGSDSLSASILTVDTTGFVPGDPPLGVGDIQSVYDIGSFVQNQGFSETNPYTLAIGPDDDMFIVDAAAEAIIRRDRVTGELSVFVTIDRVPTGIVFSGDRFYIGTLSWYPYPDGVAKIYEVDLGGNATVYRDGLTTVVDLAVDPRDDRLVGLQMTRYGFNNFIPNTGGVLKYLTGAIDTMAYELNFVTGMRFTASGDLFVSSYEDDLIYKITSSPTKVEPPAKITIPKAFELKQNYPNPFNPSTTIEYTIPGVSGTVPVEISIYDVRGRNVRKLVQKEQSPGAHSVTWDGLTSNGERISSGIYICRLSVRSAEGTSVDSRKMVVVK